jgi:hypothetical protein
LKFVTRKSAGSDGLGLREGEIRLIVLPDGRLRGAGKTRPPEDGGASASFFVRSRK